MVKVTIEYDGGTRVFTGDAVSCLVLTNEPGGTVMDAVLKGELRGSFPEILADACFDQVKVSRKNHPSLDQLNALAAFMEKAKELMNREIEANGGGLEVLKQILETVKGE